MGTYATSTYASSPDKKLPEEATTRPVATTENVTSCDRSAARSRRGRQPASEGVAAVPECAAIHRRPDTRDARLNRLFGTDPCYRVDCLRCFQRRHAT